MGIQLQGVNIVSIAMERDTSGLMKATGRYELKTNTGIIVAKQTFNDYQGVVVSFSTETNKLINDLSLSMTKDVMAAMGFT